MALLSSSQVVSSNHVIIEFEEGVDEEFHPYDEMVLEYDVWAASLKQIVKFKHEVVPNRPVAFISVLFTSKNITSNDTIRANARLEFLEESF